MYEESESERYRDKLKDDYDEFVRNQDVYKTLLNFSKDTYKTIIETALQAFQCDPDELKMDDLKELEYYLKIAKTKYYALVSVISKKRDFAKSHIFERPAMINPLILQEESGEKISISDEEEPVPIPQPEVPIEINYRMPREIPAVANNINIDHAYHPIISNHNYFPQQNMMPPPWNNPWRGHTQNYGVPVSQYPNFQLSNSRQLFNGPQNPAPSPGFIFNQSMYPLPQLPQLAPFNPPIPGPSRQIAPEKPAALSYKEHRLMKQQEEQKHKEWKLKKREEDLKKREHLLAKKQEEEKQERDGIQQKELEQEQNGNKSGQPSNYLIRKKQIEDYKKRECDEATSTSSKQSEPGKSSLKAIGSGKENKKTVRWADSDANKSLTYGREDNELTNNSSDASAKSVDTPSSSTKSPANKKCDKSANGKKVNKSKALSLVAFDFFSEAGESLSDKSNASKKDSNVDKSKNDPKRISMAKKSAELPAKKPASSKGSNDSDKTDKNTNNKESAAKIGKLKVIHAKPVIKKLTDTDSLIKRKSSSPIPDDQQAKRRKEGSIEDNNNNNEPGPSNFVTVNENNIIDIRIKEELMSDDENLDGFTDVSFDADNEPDRVQREESDHIRVKQEDDLNLNESASTVENIDIKEEVMSIIDQDNSSIHSEKLEVNDIAENFVNICDNPELLNSIAENFIDFSEFENLTEEAVNNEIQIDSQDKCASWLERNYDEQFYLTRDEEAEPDYDIVPYIPVRQLGESEIVPKEEEK